jgi:hypothetical protein
MKDYKVISFLELAKFLSHKDSTVSLEMLGGKFVLTEKKVFSEEEMKILVSDFLKKQNLASLSFEIDEEDDRFFCEVEKLELPRQIKWLKRDLKDFVDFCKRKAYISVGLFNFLFHVTEKEESFFTLEDMLIKIKECKENKQKLPWKGYGKEKEKELKSLLIDLKENKEIISNLFFNENLK